MHLRDRATPPCPRQRRCVPRTPTLRAPAAGRPCAAPTHRAAPRTDRANVRRATGRVARHRCRDRGTARDRRRGPRGATPSRSSGRSARTLVAVRRTPTGAPLPTAGRGERGRTRSSSRAHRRYPAEPRGSSRIRPAGSRRDAARPRPPRRSRGR